MKKLKGRIPANLARKLCLCCSPEFTAKMMGFCRDQEVNKTLKILLKNELDASHWNFKSGLKSVSQVLNLYSLYIKE